MAQCRLEDISEKTNRRIILVLKVVNLTLGIIIVVLGFHSFFNSTWTNDVDMENILPERKTMKAYDMCKEENWNYIKENYWNNSWTVTCGRYQNEKCEGNCPSTDLEVFNLAVIGSWFALTVINSALFLGVDKVWRIIVKYFIELLFNLVAFFLLMTGAVFYLGVTSRLDRLVDKLIEEVERKDGSIPDFLRKPEDFLSVEKYWAAALMMVLAFLQLALNIFVELFRKCITSNNT